MNDSQRLNLRAVRSFLEVVRRGGFTRAAQALGLTQPAISTHVRKLAESVGAPLFEPGGTGMELTLAGQLLFERGTLLLAEVDRLEEDLDVLALKGPGRLRVGASTTPGIFLLPGILGELMSLEPGLEVRCLVEASTGIESRVASGEIDCGLIGRPTEIEALRHEVFARDRIVLIAPRGHPLARRKKLGGREFLEFPFIMREPGSATRRHLESWFRRRSILPRVSMELGSPEAIKRMVAAGLGLSAISRHALGPDPAREGLVVLDAFDPPIERELLVIFREEALERLPFARFLEVLRSRSGARRGA